MCFRGASNVLHAAALSFFLSPLLFFLLGNFTLFVEPPGLISLPPLHPPFTEFVVRLQTEPRQSWAPLCVPEVIIYFPAGIVGGSITAVTHVQIIATQTEPESLDAKCGGLRAASVRYGQRAVSSMPAALSGQSARFWMGQHKPLRFQGHTGTFAE